MNFKVNEDFTLSIHWDNINPDECDNLIGMINENLTAAKHFHRNPIEVMNSSARMSGDLITFRLAWDSPEISFSLDEDFPEPNVPLNAEQLDVYLSTLQNMSTLHNMFSEI